MEQKDKTIHDEIHEIINIKESDTQKHEWLSTNESVETVSDFEIFSEQIKRVIGDVHRWKWAIIALHSGVQGMMVLSLKGSDGLNVLRAADKNRWLDWYNGDRCDKTRPRDLRLASFLELYKRIKSCKLRIYCDSRMFIPTATQDQSVGKLNALRNKFIHFTPKVWGLEVGGLPDIALDCLGIAEFLAWESGNVRFRLSIRHGLEKRLKDAFTSARESLCALRQQG